jgi:Tfp pilus assembly protein PilX
MQLRSRQKGVVLIFSLIILLILLIGAVALMRSMNNSLLTAGNLAFRRDLVNQGEQAVSTVINEFKTGGAMVGLTTADQPAFNYCSTILPTNNQGVPLALLGGTTCASPGTAADITGATSDVQIRYVIDRLCSATGSSSSALCAQSLANPTGGTGGSGAPPVTPPSSTVYRLSVRVSGARSTQVFLQTTFTMPGS